MPDKYGVGQDIYCYPDSNVLINNFDIRDEEELEAAEISLTAARIVSFNPNFENLSFDYFCEIHKYLFQDLYSWAGTIRTVDISKCDTRFCSARYIEKESLKLFSQLEMLNFLSDLDRNTFVRGLSNFFCEMNVIHPFREGNGRTLRLFCEILAIPAGYELNWQSVSRNNWLNANIEGYLGNLNPLIEVFDGVVTKT
ncbi:putative adenosine monophosphate-protein transferase Fic [Shewanella sp.]|uniref:putative adenosine monophosphate-protein transferase Fic n=1 Tax=Shewanella sp. TaxID=50422 RepID=UPI0035686025